MPDPKDELDRLAQTLSAPQFSTPPAAPALAAPAGIARGAQFGTVRLIEEVGRGGMGVVWRGHDQLLARDVAVKFLGQAAIPAPEMLARFVEEMRAVAAVRHPNLIHIYHADPASAVPCFVMEFIDGPSLRELLATGEALPPPLALVVLEDIAEAVAALHEHGMVHRDLKPANVLMDATATSARAVVTDLGLAVRRAPPGAAAAEVAAAGTPVYTAPELYEGRASPRSDIYALGLVAFEMLAGRRAYDGTHEQLRQAHAFQALPVEHLVLRGISGPLVEVVERATHKQPMFRYKTAGDFLRALKNAAGKDAPAASAAARAELCQRVHRCRGRAQGGTAPAGDAPAAAPSSTHGLAGVSARIIAARNEARLRHEAQPMLVPVEPPPVVTLPVTTLPLPAPPVGPVVEVNLPCLTCGYSLWSIPRESNCPECGTSISTSFSQDRLLFADPRWLKRVSLGLLLMLFSPLSFILMVSMAFIGQQASPSQSHFRAMNIAIIANAAAGMLYLLASTLLTMLKRPDRRLPWATLLCRIFVTILVLTILVDLFLPANPRGNPLLEVAMYVFTCVAGISFTLHLGALVRGQPEPGSLRWLRWLALGLMATALAIGVVGARHLWMLGPSMGHGPPTPLEISVLLAINLAVTGALLLIWIAVLLARRLLRRVRREQMLMRGEK